MLFFSVRINSRLKMAAQKEVVVDVVIHLCGRL